MATRRELTNAALETYLEFGSNVPAQLAAAMRYAVLDGGKRLRPILVLAAAELFGAPGELVIPAACGIELIHSYSLVHDDLPCMDDDELRRGRPTVHKKYGEALAVLAGDALLTYGFALVAENGSVPGVAQELVVRISREIAGSCGPAGMVGGQVLDIQSEGVTIDVESLCNLHRAKTGRLITASVRTGAILAGASESDIDSVTRYADAVGLAFQIVDDLLGETGDQAKLGKPVGTDKARGKATFPALVGVDQSRATAQSLVEDAKQHMSAYGDPSRPLQGIADFVIERMN